MEEEEAIAFCCCGFVCEEDEPLLYRRREPVCPKSPKRVTVECGPDRSVLELLLLGPSCPKVASPVVATCLFPWKMEEEKNWKKTVFGPR